MRSRGSGLALAGLAVFAVSVPGRAQQSPGPLTKRIAYYNPQWSPDGRTLLFESTLSGNYAVYTVGADGGDPRRLTPDTADSEQPNWSPDGSRVVFSSNRAGHSDLYLMDADGSHQARLTTTPGGGYYGASFSPDGATILFQGRPDTREIRDRVYVVAIDGSGMRMVSDSSYGAEGPRWHPDGRSIEYERVPYPKRYWQEMDPAAMEIARRDTRLVRQRLDGSAPVPAAPVPHAVAGDSRASWTRDRALAFLVSSRDGSPAVYEMGRGIAGARRIVDAALVPDPVPSPDGRRLAYTKTVNGWSGLYVYDIASRRERLVTGGAGVGPLGYLRSATLTEWSDTVDTYRSAPGGPIERGNGAWLERTLRWSPGSGTWLERTVWHDSTGGVTADQATRTQRGSLASWVETVRATRDSATLIVTPNRVVGWVVAVGQPPRLYDTTATAEWYASPIVTMAVAKARPAVGDVLLAPTHALYGADALATRIDSIRVVRRDTLYRGDTPIPVLVLERASGTQSWVDEGTAVELLERGNAGPARWWWHIERGLRQPRVTR
jgi:hypothetical protein